MIKYWICRSNLWINHQKNELEEVPTSSNKHYWAFYFLILVYAGGTYYCGEAAHYEVHSLSNFAGSNSIIISYQLICQIYCYLWGVWCCCNINAAMYFISAYGDKGDIYCVTNGGIDEE
eukprot:992777_1